MKKIRFRTYKTRGLGRIGIDPQVARKDGCFKEAGNSYCRQPVLKNIIVGKETKVAFSFDKVVPAKYVLISAKDLQPSHNGNIENPLHFLPEAQPRNRATSASGAETPRLMAKNLRPPEIVEGANAYSGAAIVNTHGEVIQGNGRAYALKYYWEQYPTDPKHYLEYLRENLSYLGFNKDLVVGADESFGFKQPYAAIVGGKGVKLTDLKTISFPIIVRMANVTDEEAIKLGQYKQSDLEALSTRTNEIKSRVNLIDDKKLSRVLDNVFAGSGSEDSLSQIIRNSNLLTQLIRLGAIRSDQVEEFVKNGQINALGVAYVSDIMLNLIFKGGDVNTPEIFSQLPYKIQTAILKATPSLLRVDSDKQITKEVSRAILATRDYLNSGTGSVKAWEKQVKMFGGSPKEEFSDFERKMVELFTTSSTQKLIVQVFEQYAIAVTDQAPDLVSTGRKGLDKETAIRFAFFGETPKMTIVSGSNSQKGKHLRMLKLKYKYQA